MSGAPWITGIDTTIEHALWPNEPMGVMGCTCGWWGSLEDARMHADAVEDDGGEVSADWNEAGFGLMVGNDQRAIFGAEVQS